MILTALGPLLVAMMWLNIPPVWLVLFLAVGRWIGEAGFVRFQSPIVSVVGVMIAGTGLVLMVLALVEMRRARTTPIPHMQPARLVTTGVFQFTRNPIYLGDAAVLFGLILYWDALPALPLVPIFLYVITVLFIRPEETRLKKAFGLEFEVYRTNVRRWL